MLRMFVPIFFCFLGVYIAFMRFWDGFDAVTGDLGDARFNAVVLEHTWLWVKGQHQLFNMPMFYPASNAYAYSDFMFGFAPIYWAFRAFGFELLLSFQCWMIAGSMLNYVSMFVLARRFFKITVIGSSLAAFIFAFSLPRVTHFEHAQTNPQFFIILSAMGALWWWREPNSKKAPWLFCLGAVLQFISAFYFFWFWVWTLGIYSLYLLMNADRRVAAKNWFASVSRSALVSSFLASALAIGPFFYHYVRAAKEFGLRDWVSISNTVPRLYSWINLPSNHWEWNWVPFKSWIAELPMLWEHYLSFGLVTWIGMIAAGVWVYRRKSELKFLLIPVIAMFVFTLTSGRFSTWVIMSYLFPGGGAIRAVGRLQIFMLMFWAILFATFTSHLWQSSRNRILVVMMVIFLLSESNYLSDWTFSRAEVRERINSIAQSIPSTCEIVLDPAGFRFNANDYVVNLDMVMVAFATGRITANGYSGNEPHDYRSYSQLQKWQTTSEMNGKKVCLLNSRK